jgi:hypothetical protein
MDIQTRKLNFIQEFLTIQNEEIVKMFEQLMQSKTTKISNKKFEPMSLDQYYSEIDEAMEDSESNRGMSSKQLLETIKEWK